MRKAIDMMTRCLQTMRLAALIGILLATGARPAQTADLLRIQPVTDEIIVFHFRDGHIDYNGVRPDGTFEPHGENKVIFKELLDVNAATDAGRYRITSTGDKNYAQARQPVRLGCKAKGADFNAPWKNPQFLREYWVYAQLPSALKRDENYTVDLDGLCLNLRQYQFTFDEKRLLSPTVHLSQVGFLPDARKYAYFSQWMGSFDAPQHPKGALDLSGYADRDVHLCDAATLEVRKTYHGLVLQKRAADADPSHGNWTGADVYSLDFSDFTAPGRYILVAEGIGRSHPFVIGADVYRDAYRAAMRGLYLQRQGIVKRLDEYGLDYPRAHHPDQNKFLYGRVEGAGGKIIDPRPVEGIWGWYADAGDWDCYPTHYVAPFTLLLAYDLRPQSFKDGDVGNSWKLQSQAPWIQEGTNGLPDMLDEARWLVEFYRRSRQALMRQSLGSGGVPGYVGRDAEAHMQPSWNDRREMYVSQEHVGSTFSHAGAAAYLAHCLRKFAALGGGDKAALQKEADEWLKEAAEAFDWAQAQRAEDAGARHQRELAAACLYVATGKPEYQEIFKTEWSRDSQVGDAAWVSLTANMLASGIYLVSARQAPALDRDFYAKVSSSMTARADRMTNQMEKTGFRFGAVEAGQWQPMNLITIPRVIFQAVAYEITGQRKYLDAIHATMDYLFGGNQEGISRMSGVGFERERDVFVCDAWYLLDFNHKAYRNPIFPGHSAYGLLSTWDVDGPGSEGWARSSALPEIKRWPLGETRMHNRYSIAGSEFTIHQNNVWYIFATGFLLNGQGGAAPFSRPSVRLEVGKNSPLRADAPVRLSAAASPSTERVEYYFESQFLAESRDAEHAFAVTWLPADTRLKPGDSGLITAIAFDVKGESSVPTPGGEKTVTFSLESKP